MEAINSSFGTINKWILLLLHILFTFMEKSKFIYCQQVFLTKYMESKSLFSLG